MKKKFSYNFLLTALLSCWIFPGFAEDVNLTDCQLKVVNKNIDYGRVERNNIKYLPTGIGQLSPQRETIRLSCPADIEPALTVSGTKGALSAFGFGKKSQLNIKIESLAVDGKIVAPAIRRSGIVSHDLQLKSGDIITSQIPARGKNMEFVLVVTPEIETTESLQPENTLQSDDISLSVGGNISDSFTVSSNFSSTACNPIVSGGGIVDYKNINVRQLNSSGPTVLPAKALTLSIQCDAPTNIAIRADSNRPNSLTNVREGTVNPSNAAKVTQDVITAGLGKNLPSGMANISDPDVAGLGLSGNQKIGGYFMTMPVSEISLDGVKGASRFFTQGPPTTSSKWTRANSYDTTGGSLYSGSYYFGYAKNNGTAPETVKNITAMLLIQAYITDVNTLNLSTPIQLDGSSKIELYYY